jgi:hypothetical protein
MASEQFQTEENIPSEISAEVPAEESLAKPQASKENMLALDAEARLQQKRQEYDMHIQNLIDKASKRQISYNPKLLALSGGLLTPGKTGSFFEGFGAGMKGYQEAGQEEEKQISENAKTRIDLMKMGQDLMQKQAIEQLAPKLYKVNEKGEFTGEIDQNIAQRLIGVTGDLSIVQKILDMTKPKIGHAPAGSVIFDERSGKVLFTTPKEYTPSDLKKKEDELAAMKKELEKDPNNEDLKRNIKYHEDELKKLDQLEFPDEVLTMLAQQALAGDTSVFTNVGRGTQGPNNLVRLRTKMNEIMKANGMTPQDIAAKNAEFFGIKAGERTLGTRGANVELAAQGFLNIVPLATAASQKVYRSKLLPAGKVEVFFDENVNDPDLSAFAAYNNGIVNTYARAISPTGVPTVKDKEHARKIISEAKNHTAYMAAINALENEIEAEKRAPKEVRESIRSEITGKTPSSTATKSSATQPSGKHYLNNREIVVKGNKWVYADTGEAAQ